ncbi:hypothetical protein [Streptomyces sp. Inha503]|uniref:hypothetical protein n=1 Tax=Streptomyces sp. Inha503 TaxID=3383314 RepID=UPI0039A18B31
MVPGSTASMKWPQQRGMLLGRDGVLGVAEYVIVADADPPYIVLTRIQLYRPPRDNRAAWRPRVR